ncbi:MARVEL domain-containing protein 1-like [Pieris napi]|uniref:MARVEL domain-containing protein 1-like n=1 Tax=Pieris napi TaxID=78633 RepID=UPI001FBB7F09|nr:MARVEL domain-containing protein 1-like [Pieris napi]XP_047506890.1 MARVEL domain-containing protein 1-like [Pieris napi]
MAEVGFPGQHSTTTTVTSNTTVNRSIRFDKSYLQTVPGLLKIVQVGGSLLGFICVVCSRVGTASKGAYFSWVSMIAFWFTGILLGFYLFHIVEKFYKIPWLRLEFLFAAVWSLLYLIASILATTVGDNAHYAASFFGFAATLAYMIDAYLKFRLVRAGGLAQGSRVVSKQTTEVITPPGGRY